MGGVSALDDIGVFIRQQRRNAQISVRQLAEKAGVSNPYLSQIERGLRKPSADVLRQIAAALAISPPVMFVRAGLLHAKESSHVLTAIASDPDLDESQKKMLTEIYQQFRASSASAAPQPATEDS